MAEHTPEPWHVGSRLQVKSKERPVANITTGYIPEAEANARFIAAAPDMEKALDGLLRMCFEDLSGEESVAIIEVALAALAKARGK